MRSFLASKFEMPPSAGRIVPLEGMRGFAALIVFFVHFRALFGDRVAASSFLGHATNIAGSFGHSGVDLFFLLSGFLIYGVVMESRSGYTRYLLHRLRRLYPTFGVIFVVYFLLSIAIPAESKIPRPGPAAIVYVLVNLAMLPGILNIVPMITVAWSLSYELAFYLALPLVVKALILRHWSSFQRIAFFLLLAVAQTVLCTVGISAHLRLIMFASGIVLWEVGRYQSPTGKLSAWGEFIAIAAFLANLLLIGLAYNRIDPISAVLTNVPYLYSISLFVTGFFLTLHTVFFDGILRMIFSWTYLRWVGNISYSYYLVHGLVLNGIRYLINAWFPALPHSRLCFIGLFVFCVAATLAGAAMLYLLVEKPFSLNSRRRPKKPIEYQQLSRATD